MTDPFERATLVLGIAAVVSPLFALARRGPEPLNLVHVRGATLVVLLVLGGMAVLGAVTHRLLLGIVAGAGLVGSALLQLIQAGRESNWLGGDGSTLSLMGGLGLGLLAVGLTARLHASTTPGRTITDGSAHTS